MAEHRTSGRDVFIVCNNVEELGGVQQWAHRMAGLLTGRGHRVTLVGITHAPVPHDYGQEPPYALEVLHEDWKHPTLKWRPRTVMAHAHMRARVRDARRASAMRRGAERLARLLRTARPGGVVMAAQVWAMEWVRLADPRACAGMRVIGMSHESFGASRHSSRYLRVREHFAHADRLLVLTSEDADAWARDGMSNAGHMPNPLPLAPGRRPIAREPVIACLGRLSHEKGVDLAIESWASIASRHPRWRLRLHGAGPEEDALRDLAKGLGVSASVEFAGTTLDVEGELSRASIFALPSRQEGFPTALQEAMALGLPAVAFDCAPGVRELVTDGADGLLARPGDTAAFGTALDRLIKDADLRDRLGDAALRAAVRHDPATVLDLWERLFDLLHRAPPAPRPPARVPEQAQLDPIRRAGR